MPSKRNTLNVGDFAPDFSLPDEEGREQALEDFRGKHVLLYFYPKDDTPGCTAEACGFKDIFNILKDKVVILGISSDSIDSHHRFSTRYGLPFHILSDTGKDVITNYRAAGMFTRRISYLIGPDGRIAKKYPKVDPGTHSAEVVRDLFKIQGKVVPKKSAPAKKSK